MRMWAKAVWLMLRVKGLLLLASFWCMGLCTSESDLLLGARVLASEYRCCRAAQAALLAQGGSRVHAYLSIPWPPGERQVYNLTWQGIGVGRLYLSADPTPGGWRFRLKLEPTGVAKVLGYGLESESQVGLDFFTDRFWQNLTEPFRGTTRLLYERQENDGSWARVIYPDGSETGWRSANDQMLDYLALIYYLRLHPEAHQIDAVDHLKPVQGRLEYLPTTQGLLGYRFARDDLLIEAWYRADARRTPVRFVFGRDFGRMEATLIENDNGR